MRIRETDSPICSAIGTRRNISRICVFLQAGIERVNEYPSGVMELISLRCRVSSPRLFALKTIREELDASEGNQR